MSFQVVSRDLYMKFVFIFIILLLRAFRICNSVFLIKLMILLLIFSSRLVIRTGIVTTSKVEKRHLLTN